MHGPGGLQRACIHSTLQQCSLSQGVYVLYALLGISACRQQQRHWKMCSASSQNLILRRACAVSLQVMPRSLPERTLLYACSPCKYGTLSALNESRLSDPACCLLLEEVDNHWLALQCATSSTMNEARSKACARPQLAYRVATQIDFSGPPDHP